MSAARLRLVAGISAGLLLSPLAFASDPGEPLYVMEGGRRVPTVVMPPRAVRTAPDDSVPLRDVLAPRGAAVSAAAQDADEPADAADRAGTPDRNEQPLRAARPARSRDRRYAGFPVTIAGRYARRIPAPDVGWVQNPYQYQRELDDAYDAGRCDAEHDRVRAENVQDMAERRERVLSGHQKAMSNGLAHLRKGDYASAVVALTLAAELNQGDPAARIHLAQARIALGHYAEAGREIRRALELQPKLVYIPLQLETQYADTAAFAEHAEQLAAYVAKNAGDADAHYALGFVEFQRGRLDAAYKAFRAIGRDQRDDQIRAFLKVTRPARK